MNSVSIQKEQREYELQRQERESRNLAQQLEILQFHQSQPNRSSEEGEERTDTQPGQRFSGMKGVALDVYSRLSQQEAEQYDVVKAALLDRFEYTEEGFRTRFRTSRPQRGERISQFVTRLRNLLERWIELSECDDRVHGIKDILIKEQLMNCCNKGLMTYLREKYPLSLEAMIGFAMGNGLVERYNGVLKRMLKKMCVEQPKEWDRYLPALLFAYRETPQSSMGFSPFELLYGRTVRRPLTILLELWDKDDSDQLDVMSTYENIFKLKKKLEGTCRIAQQNLKQSQVRYKTAYDRKARDRQFKVRDKVLFLLPTSHNKLLFQWQGPYEVVEKRNRMDYVIDQDGKRRIYHANLLRRYIDRGEDVDQVSIAVVEEDDQDEGLPKVELPNLHQQEGVGDVQVNPALTHDQQ
ncbi:hypothetical protein Pcinc_006300 [Petrolisthes cinctipes]|uniref:Integrase catalytic domain-containing protein n=1 Tax=Petrolisthes cinctipes TaxID=88211 RepID=A0AAE1L1Q3_PETCI|nr:hypothetical protein Pcinc_006300 [Petrolisthes cinctipes]